MGSVKNSPNSSLRIEEGRSSMGELNFPRNVTWMAEGGIDSLHHTLTRLGVAIDTT